MVRVVLPELAASASACRTDALAEPHFSGLPIRSARRASKAMLLPWRAWVAAGFSARAQYYCAIEPPILRKQQLLKVVGCYLGTFRVIFPFPRHSLPVLIRA